VQDDNPRVTVIGEIEYNNLIQTISNQASTINTLVKRINTLENHIEELEAELDEGNGIGLP
jgi:cell division protein FtsB